MHQLKRPGSSPILRPHSKQPRKSHLNTKSRRKSLSTRSSTRFHERHTPQTSNRPLRVCVIGAAGNVGQQLSLLLKANYGGLISNLSLFDTSPLTHGVSVDLSHIPTPISINTYSDESQLENAMSGSDVIVVVGSNVFKTPKMSSNDVFIKNALFHQKLAQTYSKVAANAMVCIMSNPINALVPVWAETLKKIDCYNPSKIMGVTGLDIYRANTIGEQIINKPVFVPVIGGNAGKTIVPLWSLASEEIKFDENLYSQMTSRLRNADDTITRYNSKPTYSTHVDPFTNLTTRFESKPSNSHSATLSIASAGARFVESCLVAISNYGVEGDEYANGVSEIAYVDNPLAMEKFNTQFFSSEITLDNNGIKQIIPSWKGANQYDMNNLLEMIPTLQADIKMGIDFVKNNEFKI